MTTLNTIYRLARADFLERIRGKGILVTIILTMYLSYVFVPPNTANYAAVVIGGKRLSYTSAGIGLMFGITISFFVSLFVFYLVKNAISRDRDTHVGQIIATTPTSKTIYLIGKWASNLALLMVIMVVMTLMAPIMQLLRGESNVIRIWQIIVPIWLIGLPVMSLVAGVAVSFESIRFLSGGCGNIIYFFVYVFALGGIGVVIVETRGNVPDPFGVSYPLSHIYEQEYAESADYIPDMTLLGSFEDDEGRPINVGVREWDKNLWSFGAVTARFVWLLIGMGIAAGSSLFFDRFNPTNARRKKETWMDRLWQSIDGIFRRNIKHTGTANNIHLTPLSTRDTRFRPGTVLLAEIRLTIKGQPWWWFAGVAGTIIYGLSTPADESYLVTYAAIWPVLVWSALGTREKQNRTGSLVYTTPNPLVNQLPAVWLSGVFVALLVMSGFILRLTLSGSFIGVLGIFAAALFIPALALMLGVWSGSTRMFEIVYLCMWYIAINLPLEGNWFQLIPVSSMTMISIYLAGTVMLLVLSIMGRKRMLAH